MGSLGVTKGLEEGGDGFGEGVGSAAGSSGFAVVVIEVAVCGGLQRSESGRKEDVLFWNRWADSVMNPNGTVVL